MASTNPQMRTIPRTSLSRFLQNLLLLIISVSFLPFDLLVVICCMTYNTFRKPGSNSTGSKSASENHDASLSPTILITGIRHAKSFPLIRMLAKHPSKPRIIGADFSTLAAGRLSKHISRSFVLSKPTLHSGPDAFVLDIHSLVVAEKVDLWISCDTGEYDHQDHIWPGPASADTQSDLAREIMTAQAIAQETIASTTACKCIQLDERITEQLSTPSTLANLARAAGVSIPNYHRVTSISQLSKTMQASPSPSSFILFAERLREPDPLITTDPMTYHLNAIDTSLPNVHPSSQKPYILQSHDPKAILFSATALVVAGDLRIFAAVAVHPNQNPSTPVALASFDPSTFIHPSRLVPLAPAAPLTRALQYATARLLSHTASQHARHRASSRSVSRTRTSPQQQDRTSPRGSPAPPSRPIAPRRISSQPTTSPPAPARRVSQRHSPPPATVRRVSSQTLAPSTPRPPVLRRSSSALSAVDAVDTFSGHVTLLFSVSHSNLAARRPEDVAPVLLRCTPGLAGHELALLENPSRGARNKGEHTLARRAADTYLGVLTEGGTHWTARRTAFLDGRREASPEGQPVRGRGNGVSREDARAALLLEESLSSEDDDADANESEQDVELTQVVQPLGPLKVHSVARDLVEMVVLPALALVLNPLGAAASVGEAASSLLRFVESALYWRDGAFCAEDPLPWWVGLHVDVPLRCSAGCAAAVGAVARSVGERIGIA